MPELPEVETIRRALTPLLVGRRIAEALLIRRDVLVMPTDPAGGFSRQRGRGGKEQTQPAPITPADLLDKHSVTELRRRGKQLAIIAEHRQRHRALIVQLGMSGQLLAVPSKPKTDQPTVSTHVHARWKLDDGLELLFRDPRRFGGLRVFPDAAALDTHWLDLGPDGLDLDAAALWERLEHTRRPIKAALLDQAVVAGVGNIYADESLFIAGIHPTRRADTLRPQEGEALAAAIRRVLAQAVDAGGSTLRDYITPGGEPGGYQMKHQVYGRGGKPCMVCGKPLKTATAAGRTTVWCASCQPTARSRRTTT